MQEQQVLHRPDFGCQVLHVLTSTSNPVIKGKCYQLLLFKKYQSKKLLHALLQERQMNAIMMHLFSLQASLATPKDILQAIDKHATLDAASTQKYLMPMLSSKQLTPKYMKRYLNTCDAYFKQDAKYIKQMRLPLQFGDVDLFMYLDQWYRPSVKVGCFLGWLQFASSIFEKNLIQCDILWLMEPDAFKTRDEFECLLNMIATVRDLDWRDIFASDTKLEEWLELLLLYAIVCLRH